MESLLAVVSKKQEDQKCNHRSNQANSKNAFCHAFLLSWTHWIQIYGYYSYINNFA